MPTPAIVDVEKINGGAVYTIKPAKEQSMARLVETYFADEGYSLERGSAEDAVYGKGSKVLRFLFGAFVQRHTFHVAVEQVGKGTVEVEIKRLDSGFAGGLIGVSQVRKEEESILDGFEEWAESGFPD